MPFFNRASTALSNWFGRPTALLCAIIYVGYLFITGQLDWHDPVLVISILTWWQLFPIQAAQNRDTAAMHKKMDALIRANKRTPNTLIGLEKKDD